MRIAAAATFPAVPALTAVTRVSPVDGTTTTLPPWIARDAGGRSTGEDVRNPTPFVVDTTLPAGIVFDRPVL